MQRSRSGFTIIELVIVIVVGSILTSIALTQISGAQGRIAVQGARTTYAAVQARARAHGIEMGQNVLFHVDSTGDSIWIEHDGGVIEKILFGNEQNVDIRISLNGAPASMTLCFSPRGYTDTSCNTTNLIHRVEFWQESDSSTLLTLPMGQLVLE
jgi:prepilin-type N-terminal cleavage/methylation domain-containing protein